MASTSLRLGSHGLLLPQSAKKLQQQQQQQQQQQRQQRQMLPHVKSDEFRSGSMNGSEAYDEQQSKVRAVRGSRQRRGTASVSHIPSRSCSRVWLCRVMAVAVAAVLALLQFTGLSWRGLSDEEGSSSSSRRRYGGQMERLAATWRTSVTDRLKRQHVQASKWTTILTEEGLGKETRQLTSSSAFAGSTETCDECWQEVHHLLAQKVAYESELITLSSGSSSSKGRGQRRRLQASDLESSILKIKTAHADSNIIELQKELNQLQHEYDASMNHISALKDLFYQTGSWHSDTLTRNAGARAMELLSSECPELQKGQHRRHQPREETWKGYSCRASPAEIAKLAVYGLHRLCADEWLLSHELVFDKKCFALPLRRCFVRTPQHPTEVLPLPQALFNQSALVDDNVRWAMHGCKSFHGLASINNLTNATLASRKAAKLQPSAAASAFNLTIERQRWTGKGVEGEKIAEVLRMKNGSIRIGVDTAGVTGSLAAAMALHGVTIVTLASDDDGDAQDLNVDPLAHATAPYLEAIALRGVLPLMVPLTSRLPFFDNSMDLIHSSGIVGSVRRVRPSPVEFEASLYEWDRVLRPGGLIWFNNFEAAVDEMPLLVAAIEMLHYKKLKWSFSPQPDYSSSSSVTFLLCLSAVIEKPSRLDPEETPPPPSLLLIQRSRERREQREQQEQEPQSEGEGGLHGGQQIQEPLQKGDGEQEAKQQVQQLPEQQGQKEHQQSQEHQQAQGQQQAQVQQQAQEHQQAQEQQQNQQQQRQQEQELLQLLGRHEAAAGGIKSGSLNASSSLTQATGNSSHVKQQAVD